MANLIRTLIIESKASSPLKKGDGLDFSAAAQAQRGTAEAQRDAETAKEHASEADERAALNEREAARLRKAAEDERLARVKIEKELAPRTLTDSDRGRLSDQLRHFAPSFSACKVKVSSFSGDAEGMVFSLEIVDILARAGIA